MAHTIHFRLNSPERLDSLCTSCWLPALWSLTGYMYDENGVTSLNIGTYCDGCSETQRAD